jgi:hypothetical protein
MPPVSTLLHRYPRFTAAVSFGLSTGLLTHFTWYPDARFSGSAPILTLAAGCAHAVSGAITGPRLLDPARTRTNRQAALTGAGTSLLALVLFAPAMAAWVSASGVPPRNPLTYVVLTVFTGLFAFLGAGWALLLACVVVALGLHRMTASPDGPTHDGG